MLALLPLLPALVLLDPVCIPLFLSDSSSSFIFAAAAVLYGVVAGTACNFATQLKYLGHYDDALDVNIFVVRFDPILISDRSLRLTLLAAFVVISSLPSLRKQALQNSTVSPSFLVVGWTTITFSSDINSQIPCLVCLTPLS